MNRPADQSASTTRALHGDAPSPKQRFETVNKDRLRRVLDSLSLRQATFIRVLPLLWHVNHPQLPGYVAQETACGIFGYEPDPSALSGARQISRAFSYEHRNVQQFAINGLYLMGSPGTIAYTRDSDFDVWMVHAPGLSTEAVAQLQDKAQRIEQYAAQMGLEVHFFVFDAEGFRDGGTLSLSNESSGSSQHFLLLDEFYRSSLVLAGQAPLWWAVPSAEDHNYTAYVADAVRTRKVNGQHFVDFGGLEEIPAGEFFGATVWQLFKSIDSPYKSVMKLLLMEAYAAVYPDETELLSHRHKRALMTPGITLDQLDPYLAMYRRVEEYLLANQDLMRLRVLRRAFYLKANEPLSTPPDQRGNSWRREVLQALVDEWGWRKFELLHLDNRPKWHIDSAIEERRDIVKVLQKSYAALSDFARNQGDRRITETDLTVLGRKLYAAFDKKPNKLDLITRGLCAAPEEAQLSLLQITFERAGTVWVLYSGVVTPDDVVGRTLLIRSSSLVEVLAWCFFNRLCNAQTAWHCFVGTRRHSTLDIRRVLDALEQAYPSREMTPVEGDAFNLPPRAVAAVFFINFGVDAAPASLPDGSVLTSNRTDAFQFGGRRINLVKSVDLVLQTSWEELFSYRFEGEESPLQAACEYLNRLDQKRERAGEEPSVHCFDADYGQAIAQRVGRFLSEVRTAHAQVDENTSTVVTVRLGEKIHDVCMDDGGARSRSHANLASLTRALGEPTRGFKQVWFDPACAPDSPLHFVYAQNQRGKIQVFGLHRRERIDVFVLDSDGSLVSYPHPDTDPLALFSHLHQFIENAQRHSLGSDTDKGTLPCVAEFTLLKKQGKEGFSGQPVVLPTSQRQQYLSLRLFVDLDAAGKTQFSAYLDDEVFSSGEHGTGFFDAIASAVLSQRASRGSYPIFITDLELSDRLLRTRSLEPHRILELLKQKLRIERQLLTARVAAAEAPIPA